MSEEMPKQIWAGTVSIRTNFVSMTPAGGWYEYVRKDASEEARLADALRAKAVECDALRGDRDRLQESVAALEISRDTAWTDTRRLRERVERLEAAARYADEFLWERCAYNTNHKVRKRLRAALSTGEKHGD